MNDAAQIFGLPDLVLDVLYPEIDHVNAFIFSLCSTHSFYFARNVILRKLETYTISLHTSANYNVLMVKNQDDVVLKLYVDQGKWYEFEKGFEEKHQGILHRKIFTFEVSGTRIKTYWKNPLVGMKILIEHVSNLFGAPIHGITLDDQSRIVYQKPTELLEFLKFRQRSIPQANVILTELPDDFYAQILRKLKLVKNLRIQLTPGSYFEKNDTRKWKFDQLTVVNGYWLNSKRLLSMNCKNLILEEKIPASWINKFLKAWIKGGVKNLKQFTMWGDSPYLAKVLKDIDYRRNRERILEARDDEDPIEPGRRSPLDIQSNSGIYGTVFYSGPRGNPRFDFFVWK